MIRTPPNGLRRGHVLALRLSCRRVTRSQGGTMTEGDLETWSSSMNRCGRWQRPMFLSSVEIRNFRSFEELRRDLQPGLNVLVGRNNTGKTNLLRAIRQAVGPSASRGDALWLERDDFYRASAADV